MRNKFRSISVDCRAWVRPGEGYLLGKDEHSGFWRVSCQACRDAARVDAWASLEAKRLRAEERSRAAEERARVAREEAARARRAGWPEDDWIRRLEEAIASLKAREAAFPPVPPCLMVLGLRPPVDDDAIRGRFRELAKQHHPDHGGGAADFIRIREAYSEALSIYGSASA